jgi:hypothetical protein
MAKRTGISAGQGITALAVILAAGAAAYFALGGRLGGTREIAPPDDTLRLRRTDPKLIAYEEVEGIPTGMDDPRGLAVGGSDSIYVVGDRLVRVFDGNGTVVREFPTASAGTSLAFGFGGWVFVAARNRVEVHDENGQRLAVWDAFDPNSMFSSISVAFWDVSTDVFVADDNAQEVLRCDGDGNIVARIGRRDPNDSILLRSPHFDVAFGPDGLLWITNPGRLRVEAFTFDGEREVSWGEETMEISGFSGCCNPKDIAFLPDGGIVTSEKGLPRVKEYSREGKLLRVVAGPESFDQNVRYLDLAVDGRGRVLVLDPVRKKVRIFVRKGQG